MAQEKSSTENSGRENRGFAAMDPKQVRGIASEGGKAAHQKGTAHKFTSEEAAEAGRKGGQARARNSQENDGNKRNGGENQQDN